MKERHFLFTDAMARAIVDGRKTQTRRPLAALAGGPVPAKLSLGAVGAGPSGTVYASFDDHEHRTQAHSRLPAAVGNVLIGRECFALDVPGCEHQSGVSYRADHNDKRGDGPAHPMRWRPSIHMPRWAARIVRPVTGVRVERLRSITEADAVAEGFGPAGDRHAGTDARHEFACAWDDIYVNRDLGWEVNPWVVVIEFGRENAKGVA